MSREFWARAFPHGRGATKISEFNKVANWSSPPEKNSETEESTKDIANETAKYFAHLGMKRQRNNETESEAEKMLKLLEEGETVNESTYRIDAARTSLRGK